MGTFLAIMIPLALFIIAAGILADRHGQKYSPSPSPVAGRYAARRPPGRHARRGRHAA